MKRGTVITIAGISFLVGGAVGATILTAVQNNGIFCYCVDTGGEVDWVGNCPDEVKNVLMQQYDGYCP